MAEANRRPRYLARVLGILRGLSEGTPSTVHQLAARFKVRRETIYRDLRMLIEAGFPVMGDEEGRLSRPRLAAGFPGTIPPVPLTRKELAALVWAVKEAGHRQPFQAALSMVLPKLQALTPAREGRAAFALDGAVSGWQRGAKDYAALEPMILRLVEGIIARRRCKVTYQVPWRDAPRSYGFDPYRLLSVQGGLYCVGRVPPHDNLATLAVDRISEVMLTDEAFTIAASFDPKRLESDAFGVSWEKPVTVVVRFSAAQAPYVRERQWHPSQRIRELKDGRAELTFRAGGEFEITRWVLGWGDAAQVVKPARLRMRVRTALQRALRNSYQ